MILTHVKHFRQTPIFYFSIIFIICPNTAGSKSADVME